MNGIVIGLGSMGKRRIRLLRDLYSQDDLTLYGIDSNENRRNEISERFGISCYSSIQELNCAIQLDFAVVSTSPISHYPIIQDLLNSDIHVFTEINLVDHGYDELIRISEEKKLILFLSSTFLYRKEIEYITRVVKNYQQPVGYQYHVGQYLPDWHPWENYKDFFVSRPETGGIRELLAIELPWIVQCFGKIKRFQSIKKKLTKLEIPYEDVLMLQTEHETGHIGNLIIDLVSKKACREFSLFGENLWIEWHGKPDTLKSYSIETRELENVNLYKGIKQESDYADNIIEDAYEAELIEFFEIIKDRTKKAKYSFRQDQEIISYINAIEKSKLNGGNL